MNFSVLQSNALIWNSLPSEGELSALGKSTSPAKRDIAFNVPSPTSVAEAHAPYFLALESVCYTKKGFTSHPLLKYTKEKEVVFETLCYLVKETDFPEKYQAFLSHIASEDWTSHYLENPEELAYISLVAFLDKKITQEELFVCHMVASILQKSPLDKPPAFVVLDQNNVEHYLERAMYPLFAPVMRTNKTEEELLTSRQTFIDNLAHKSVLERTAICYWFSPSSVEHYTYTETPAVTGLLTEDTVFMIPPALCLEVCERSSSEKVLSGHTWMFGHSKNLSFLREGRPFTIDSPLFSNEKVHEWPAEGLSFVFHDLLGHMLAEYHNPYAKEFICVGDALLDVHFEQSPGQQKNIAVDIRLLGIALLDRLALPYPRLLKPVAFWISLVKLLTKGMGEDALRELGKEYLVPVLMTHLPAALWNEEMIKKAYSALSHPLILQYDPELEEISSMGQELLELILSEFHQEIVKMAIFSLNELPELRKMYKETNDLRLKKKYTVCLLHFHGISNQVIQGVVRLSEREVSSILVNAWKKRYLSLSERIS